MERRLWPDGGYYLDNGASVCGPCHLRCESTEVDTGTVRGSCGTTSVLLPPHLYSDQIYDKWGNPVLPNEQRLRGELFNNQSVQKVIAPFLGLFTNRVKYPRTYHLPWSPGVGSDDRIIQDLSGFEGQEVVVTAKMDGEQTTMYRDGFHARSLDSPSHPSRDWLWGLHRQIGHDIPEGWRVCGENLYAVHSIRYMQLRSHFLAFSLWDDGNRALSWDDTKDWASLLGLTTVELLWRGVWDENVVKGLFRENIANDPCEGFVVRVARQFSYGEFRKVAAKYVRKDHVHTHGHWMRQAVEVNGLAK